MSEPNPSAMRRCASSGGFGRGCMTLRSGSKVNNPPGLASTNAAAAQTITAEMLSQMDERLAMRSIAGSRLKRSVIALLVFELEPTVSASSAGNSVKTPTPTNSSPSDARIANSRIACTLEKPMATNASSEVAQADVTARPTVRAVNTVAASAVTSAVPPPFAPACGLARRFAMYCVK